MLLISIYSHSGRALPTIPKGKSSVIAVLELGEEPTLEELADGVDEALDEYNLERSFRSANVLPRAKERLVGRSTSPDSLDSKGTANDITRILDTNASVADWVREVGIFDADETDTGELDAASRRKYAREAVGGGGANRLKQICAELAISKGSGTKSDMKKNILAAVGFSENEAEDLDDSSESESESSSSSNSDDDEEDVDLGSAKGKKRVAKDKKQGGVKKHKTEEKKDNPTLLDLVVLTQTKKKTKKKTKTTKKTSKKPAASSNDYVPEELLLVLVHYPAQKDKKQQTVGPRNSTHIGSFTANLQEESTKDNIFSDLARGLRRVYTDNRVPFSRNQKLYHVPRKGASTIAEVERSSDINTIVASLTLQKHPLSPETYNSKQKFKMFRLCGAGQVNDDGEDEEEEEEEEDEFYSMQASQQERKSPRKNTSKKMAAQQDGKRYLRASEFVASLFKEGHNMNGTTK